MDSKEKLLDAMQLIKNAARLINEAVGENETLRNFSGDALNIIAYQLNTTADDSANANKSANSTLERIITSEGLFWHNESGEPELSAQNYDANEEWYFYPTLRNWISSVLMSDTNSTDEELIKSFIEKGIHPNLAHEIVACERKDCLSQGESYKIDFSSYEPVDDRLFTVTQLFDFAYEVGQEAMSAGFLGKKSIDTLSLDEFILEKLDSHRGDNAYDFWIPRSEWPRDDAVKARSRNKKHIAPTKRNNKGKGPKL